MVKLTTHAEGPGSWQDMVGYIRGVLEENVELKEGCFLSHGLDGMSRAMLTSLLHRLGVTRYVDPKDVAAEAYDEGVIRGAGKKLDGTDQAFERWWTSESD